MAAGVVGSREGLGAEACADWRESMSVCSELRAAARAAAALCVAAFLSGTSLLWSFHTVVYCWQEGGGDLRSPLASDHTLRGGSSRPFFQFSSGPSLLYRL